MKLTDPINACLRKLVRDVNKALQLNRKRIAISVTDLSTIISFAQEVAQQHPASSNNCSYTPGIEQESPRCSLPCDDELLVEKEAAQFLKINPRTLTNWRWNGTVVIPYVKIGRMIRYRRSTLEQMLINGFDS